MKFFQFNFKDDAVFGFFGEKSQGKSLEMAKIAWQLLTNKKSARPIYSNKRFWGELEKHPRIFYWKEPKELYQLKGTDIFWDEIGTDLPPGAWQNTPQALKQIMSHAAKRGNRIFLNHQVYEDLDISVRRQIQRFFYLKKWIGSRRPGPGKPPIKAIWGWYRLIEFKFIESEVARQVEKEKIQTEEGIPILSPVKLIATRFRWIGKKWVRIFDTSEEIPAWERGKLREIVYDCIEGTKCRDPRYGHKVIHEVI